MDEAVAIALLQNFGEPIFPGVSGAKIQFAYENPDRFHDDTLYVGIGQENSPFDEHRETGRLQNTCAAVLVAQHLRVCNYAGVKGLLHETLFADTQPKVFPSQLANLIKAMHRVKGGKDQMGTYLWALEAINAIIFSKTFNEDYDLRTAWKHFCEDRKLEKVPDNVTMMVGSSQGRRNGLITELASICALMRPEKRQNWLPETFAMLVEDAKMFEEAVRLVQKTDQVIDLETPKGPEPLLFLETDNEHAHRAAASTKTGKMGVVVIRTTVGHTQIFINPKLSLGLGAVAQMLRMAEYRARTGKVLKLKAAEGMGTIPECPEWHLPNTNLVLNGSLTHPSVSPSILTLDQVKEIVVSAFLPEKMSQWIKDYYKPITGIDALADLEDVLEKK